MKQLLVILAMFMPLVTSAQEEGNSSSSQKTTFEKFTSTIGTIVKYKDYELTSVTGKFGSGMLANEYIVRGKVREVVIDKNKSTFLHLSYQGYQRPERNAYIAYEDVVEINKALSELISQSVSDTTGDANYLENKFQTKDNFSIGYYISKTVNKKGEVSNDLRWYIDLDNRYNYSTAFFPNSKDLQDFFTSALAKMEGLK